MMIAMTCGFGILLSAGMVMTSRVIRAMQLRSGSDKSTVRTPIGDFRFEKAKDVGPSLPIYPEAALVLPGAGPVQVARDDNSTQVVSSMYHTNASREFVASWYAEHLTGEFTRQDNGPKKLPEVFQKSHIADDDVTFLGERGDQVRLVSLSADDTGTKITLLRSISQQPAPIPAPAESPARSK
jgi:hypothetical protein